MLLPSALSCDHPMAQPKPQRPSRPKLPSFERYDPCRRSQSPVLGLIASCRALQSMLGDRFSSTPSPSPSIDATIRATSLASPFGEPTPPCICPPAPRGQHKRRRSCFSEDIDGKWADESSREQRDNRSLATPKRRRIIPVDLPPGLMASDFEALADTGLPSPTTPCSRRFTQIDLPIGEERCLESQSRHPTNMWSENDDRLLVEVVLSKLNLSTREWNDCALRLGKDKDSLGRRWQLLLGEGNVGLRRGTGRTGRVDLDIKSWQ